MILLKVALGFQHMHLVGRYKNSGYRISNILLSFIVNFCEGGTRGCLHYTLQTTTGQPVTHICFLPKVFLESTLKELHSLVLLLLRTQVCYLSIFSYPLFQVPLFRSNNIFSLWFMCKILAILVHHSSPYLSFIF